MKIFTSWSLTSKIIFISVITMTLSCAVLFGLYTYESKYRTVDAYVGKARAICLTAESTRMEMEEKWKAGVFNVAMAREYMDKGELNKLLAIVPVVSAWNAAMRKAEQGGYVFKVPKYSPRNRKNEPDYGMDYAVEGPALEKIKKEGLNEYYVIDKRDNSIRYFLPVRLSDTCMLCHGDPATSKNLWGIENGMDPTGGKMENWKSGEIHGAFEVIQSLNKADIDLRNGLIKAAVVALLSIIIAGLVFYMVIRFSVSKPIQEIISGLKNSSEIVTTSSNHVSESSNTLAEGAQNQAASLEQTSATLEEITTRIKNTATGALKADSMMKDAGASVDTANLSMERLTSSMDDISSSGKETSGIIRTIDEIAFQTNLLALNAAVEAARAGEKGAGFAVVADEVRSLAIRAADAASRTSSLIEIILEKIDAGMGILTQTNTSFNNVLESTTKVGEFVGEISQSAGQQAEEIEQIRLAMSQIDDVIQKTAAISEESAAASADMKKQAVEMNDLVAEMLFLINGSE